MVRHPRFGWLALALAPAVVACQPSVQAYFADHGYAFPLHVDRSARVAELGSAGFRAKTCRPAPDMTPLLARATAAIRR
jgi:hypothetical protein